MLKERDLFHIGLPVEYETASTSSRMDLGNIGNLPTVDFKGDPLSVEQALEIVRTAQETAAKTAHINRDYKPRIEDPYYMD